MVPLDTDADAYAVQRDVYRRLGGRGRVDVMFRLNATSRPLAMAGIRARHPGYTDTEVRHACARLLLGDTLVRASGRTMRSSIRDSGRGSPPQARANPGPAWHSVHADRIGRHQRVDLAFESSVAIVTPEDAILSKLESARRSGDSERQMRDAAGVLEINPRLDRAYIERWASVLGVSDLWRELSAPG